MNCDARTGLERTLAEPHAFAAFPLLLTGLHGAQRALLRRRPPH